MSRAAAIPGIIFSFALAGGFFCARPGFCASAQYEKMKELEEREKPDSPPALHKPQVEYTADNLADPFQAPMQEKPGPEEIGGQAKPRELPQLKVEGMIWGGKFSQAIINSNVYKIGDKIEGAQIQKIEPQGVTLLFDGSEVVLPAPSAGGVSQKPQGGEQ